MTQAREPSARELAVYSFEPGIPLSGSSSNAAPLLGGEPPSVPEQSWSKVFFTWVLPFLRYATTVDKVDPDRCFKLEDRAEPARLFDNFHREWKKSLAEEPFRKPGRRLLSVIFRVHLPEVWPLWMGRVVQALLAFTFPVSLNLITKFVTDEDANIEYGIGLALISFVLQVLAVFIDNNVSLGLQSFGLRIRSSLITAIFRKVILLRHDVLTSYTTGKLNNMITTDVDKARRVVRYIHILLFAPVQVAISMVSLHYLMGKAVYVGFVWLLIVIFLNPALMHIAGKLEDIQQSNTDERVRTVTETISAIQMVKSHAWEEPMTHKVTDARKKRTQVYVAFVLPLHYL
jgi:hypothetical protein